MLITESTLSVLAGRLAPVVLMGAAALTGCSPVPTAQPPRAPAAAETSAPTVTALAPLSTQDQINIYAAVLRQLYGPDDTFGGTFQAPVAYVLRQTDDAAGWPPASPTASVVLPTAIQAGISAALDDLPTHIIWVDQFSNVPLESQTGAVTGRGAAFHLGQIAVQPDGKAQVAGSIYVASLAAGGTTYVLEWQGGQWVVTGNTGVRWIS